MVSQCTGFLAENQSIGAIFVVALGTVCTDVVVVVVVVVVAPPRLVLE